MLNEHGFAVHRMLDVPGVAKQLAWFQQNHFVDGGFTVKELVDKRFGFAP